MTSVSDDITHHESPSQRRKSSTGRRELPKLPIAAGSDDKRHVSGIPSPADPNSSEKLKEAQIMIKKLQKRNKQLKHDYEKLQSASASVSSSVADVSVDQESSLAAGTVGGKSTTGDVSIISEVCRSLPRCLAADYVVMHAPGTVLQKAVSSARLSNIVSQNQMSPHANCPRLCSVAQCKVSKIVHISALWCT